MPTPTRLLAHLTLPAAGAVFVAFWVTAEAGRIGTRHDAISLFAMLIPVAAAVALSRMRPMVAVALVVAVPVAQLLPAGIQPGSTTWPVLEGALLVAFVCGRWAPTRARWASLAAGVVWATAVGASLVFSGQWLKWMGIGEATVHPELALRWSLTLVGVHAGLWASCWTAGVALQVAARSRATAEQLDRTARELLVAGYELRAVRERTEIAQEVHDVLAHSLTVVIALADGSRFLRTAKPESTEASLQRIADTSRTALVDLRGLIEGLTDDTDRPQPRLAELPELLERIRGTGAQVHLREQGVPGGLTPAQELAVYRIAQESLTNVLKHAGEEPSADISLAWDGPGLLLTIASSGASNPRARASSSDHRGVGIAGMEHRARLAGGWLTAGADPDGSFLVSAFVPTSAPAERALDSDEDAA